MPDDARPETDQRLPPVADPLIGRTIARKYVLESLIGRGGIAAVYRARQQNLERPVAIKILHETYLDDPTFAGRFKREAKSASKLVHPNLVQVFDFGEEPDGRLYMAMEFLEGENLHKVIRSAGTLKAETIVDLMSQALAALAAAHDEGMIHRDLKPHNLMVVKRRDDDGNEKTVVKLCDFGFVKNVDVKTEKEGQRTTITLTQTGTVIGTPEYMSPEQATGADLDPRSDLYSMGIILYEMLTGRVPFRAKTMLNVMIMQVEGAPAKPSIMAEDVHPGLEAVCLRALEKSPDDRFASAREMRAELRAAIGIKDAGAGNSTRPPPMRSVTPSGRPAALVQGDDARGSAKVARASTKEAAAKKTSDRPPADSRKEAATPKVGSVRSRTQPAKDKPRALAASPAPAAASAQPQGGYVPLLIGVVIVLAGIAIVLLLRH
jgi:serine/threonine-protein kinase